MNNTVYPKTISVEVTNNCNSQCLICPHGHNLITSKGYMTKDLFHTILDRIDHLKEEINLEMHGVGEPLLHVQLPEFIKEAALRGFWPTLCTNAILLNESTTQQLHSCGLKKIVVSLETKENYERIRGINIYDYVLRNVRHLADTYPDIELEIYMISLEGDDIENFSLFKKQFPQKHIRFNQFQASDWCGTIPFDNLSTKSGNIVRNSVCPLFRHYCAIDFQGFVRHCYLDYNSEFIFGDINKQSFDSIWNSAQRLDVMENMRAGLYDNLLPCQNCVFPFIEASEEEASSDVVDNDEFKRPEMQLLSKIKQARR